MIVDESKDSLRPMFCELNILTRSDGSAMLTQGRFMVVLKWTSKLRFRFQVKPPSPRP